MNEIVEKLVLRLDELIKVLTPPSLFSNLGFWSNIILMITLLVLIWYTIETHRIANQTKESNLRPIIMRSGFVESWDKISFKCEQNVLLGSPMEFTILKNIATSISGYIVKNGLKFELLFGHEISQIGENMLSFLPKWGWMKADNKLLVIFKEENGVVTEEPNQIVINYQDAEGNNYSTIEDDNFNQKCFRGKKQ